MTTEKIAKIFTAFILIVAIFLGFFVLIPSQQNRNSLVVQPTQICPRKLQPFTSSDYDWAIAKIKANIPEAHSFEISDLMEYQGPSSWCVYAAIQAMFKKKFNVNFTLEDMFYMAQGYCPAISPKDFLKGGSTINPSELTDLMLKEINKKGFKLNDFFEIIKPSEFNDITPKILSNFYQKYGPLQINCCSTGSGFKAWWEGRAVSHAEVIIDVNLKKNSITLVSWKTAYTLPLDTYCKQYAKLNNVNALNLDGIPLLFSYISDSGKSDL